MEKCRSEKIDEEINKVVLDEPDDDIDKKRSE